MLPHYTRQICPSGLFYFENITYEVEVKRLSYIRCTQLTQKENSLITKWLILLISRWSHLLQEFLGWIIYWTFWRILSGETRWHWNKFWLNLTILHMAIFKKELCCSPLFWQMRKVICTMRMNGMTALSFILLHFIWHCSNFLAEILSELIQVPEEFFNFSNFMLWLIL